MRMPRPRFTVRALAAAVLVAGLACWMLERRGRFLRRAEAHDRGAAAEGVWLWRPGVGRVLLDGSDRGAWHEAMAAKYRRAAAAPYLPVAADAPAPAPAAGREASPPDASGPAVSPGEVLEVNPPGGPVRKSRGRPAAAPAPTEPGPE